MNKKIISVAIFLLLCAFVSPAAAIEKIDLSKQMSGSDPMQSAEMADANNLMWDIVKLLIGVFFITLIINAFVSGTSLNIGGALHSVSIRSHGISSLFMMVGSLVGVLLALWVCAYLWNNYLSAL